MSFDLEQIGGLIRELGGRETLQSLGHAYADVTAEQLSGAGINSESLEEAEVDGIGLARQVGKMGVRADLLLTLHDRLVNAAAQANVPADKTFKVLGQNFTLPAAFQKLLGEASVPQGDMVGYDAIDRAPNAERSADFLLEGAGILHSAARFCSEVLEAKVVAGRATGQDLQDLENANEYLKAAGKLVPFSQWLTQCYGKETPAAQEAGHAAQVRDVLEHLPQTLEAAVAAKRRVGWMMENNPTVQAAVRDQLHHFENEEFIPSTVDGFETPKEFIDSEKWAWGPPCFERTPGELTDRGALSDLPSLKTLEAFADTIAAHQSARPKAVLGRS